MSRIRDLLGQWAAASQFRRPREDPARGTPSSGAERQRLDTLLLTPCDAGTLIVLAATIRGARSDPPLAIIAQQAIGRRVRA